MIVELLFDAVQPDQHFVHAPVEVAEAGFHVHRQNGDDAPVEKKRHGNREIQLGVRHFRHQPDTTRTAGAFARSP